MIMGFIVDASGVEEIIVPAKIAAGVRMMELAVAKTITDVERGAKIRSRVDSGTMRNEWTNTGVKTERVGVRVLIYGEVYNPVDYTIHNEFGTWKMPAQPMAIPALDEATPGFVAAIESITGGLV